MTVAKNSYSAKMTQWQILLVILFVHKLKVKHLREIGGHNLEFCFSKCFSKANSIASAERYETEWVSLSAFWSQAQRILIVESLWEELIRSLPLAFVEVDQANAKCNCGSSLEIHAANLCIFFDLKKRGRLKRCLESECFIDKTMRVVEILN